MREFYLYRRNKKSKIYYAQILNPNTGNRMPGKSTGETDRDRAVYVAMDWLKNGVISSNGILRETDALFSVNELLYKLKRTELIEIDVTAIMTVLKDKGFYIGTGTGQLDNGKGQNLIDYLSLFWNYKKSPYITSKNNHRKIKKQISKEYALNMGRSVKKYWEPYFGSLSLLSLTNDSLEDFGNHLITLKKLDRKGNKTDDFLSTSSINHIIKAGTVAFNYAKKKGLIRINPADNLQPFEGNKENEKRGILTEEEVNILFTKGDWSGNPGNRLGNLLAMQTGIRLGELRGLRVKDLGNDRLYVRNSWNDLEGLKGTKTGKDRAVPLLLETKNQLIEYAKLNPHGYNPDTFVLWNINTPDRPQGDRSFSKSFNKAVDSIGINRLGRNIVFHSWRHFYTHSMDIIIGTKTMKLTGHNTESVYKNYANHEDEKEFQKAIAATDKVFGKILDFPKKKAAI